MIDHRKAKSKKPSEFAELLGANFIGTNNKTAISFLGQYFTPRPVAKLMASYFEEISEGASIKILDPGAGTGILSTALIEEISRWRHKPKQIELTAYEIDIKIKPTLIKSYEYLKIWLKESGISFSFTVKTEDFILKNASVFDQSLQQSIFQNSKAEEFDLIIANPPYFKISKSDPRAQVAASIVHGQPNIYALFMAMAASLLRKNGQLCFITPRSFASGLYFKKFRKTFFDQITPTSIHIFQSRDKAFNKDSVLQENIILHGKKDFGLTQQSNLVKISSCNGLSDIERLKTSEVPCATEYGQHWASSAVLFNLNENLRFSNFPSNVTLWQPEYRQTTWSCEFLKFLSRKSYLLKKIIFYIFQQNRFIEKR